MKSIVKKALLVLIALSMMVAPSFSMKTHAKAQPLDEILNYDLTVNMRADGTMDIKYSIRWKVLDDASEGPLEWVKIGCPNKHVDQITALSDNIKKIGYMSKDGGSYIKVTFDREYHAGEIIQFDYSIHQAYMYTIEKDEHLCRYSFTPGWFEEIAVESITIRWNADNVIESNATASEDGYLIWKDSLAMGERLNASVKYNLDVFDTDEDQQYTEGDNGIIKKIIIAMVVIFIIALIIFIICSDDDYDSGSGFYGGGHTTYIHHSSCVSSCVSCACACACAGGGRAGCSMKDFYHTNLKTAKLEKVLRKTH